MSKTKLDSFVSLWLSSSCLALPLKLLCSWGSCRVEWVFFYFSWRNRFEIQGDHLLIHCCLATQTVQHQNPRILCLTGRSYDVWYKQKESKPSHLPSKSWGPLSLDIMMLSFLVWVKWHSFSWGRKYILPLQFQDCRSLLGEEKTEYVWVPSVWLGNWVLLSALNTDLMIYLQCSAWIWREGWRLQQEILPEHVMLFEMCSGLEYAETPKLESPKSEQGWGWSGQQALNKAGCGQHNLSGITWTPTNPECVKDCTEIWGCVPQLLNAAQIPF